MASKPEAGAALPEASAPDKAVTPTPAVPSTASEELAKTKTAPETAPARVKDVLPVDPATPSAPARPSKGEAVPGDGLELVEVIGQGAGGLVWRATDKESGVDVAVKIIDLDECAAVVGMGVWVCG